MFEFRNNYYDDQIKDVVLRDGKKELKILFGGNLDLYFDIIDDEELEKEEFNQEIEYLVKNYEEEWIYFNRLYNDIISDKEQNKRVGLVKNNVINWYSDENSKENANMLSISRENEGIKFVFHRHPNNNEMSFGIPIRIRNSGSRYDPSNIHFMKMYKEFQELEKEIKTRYRIEDEER